MEDLISRQAAIEAFNKEIIKRRLLDDVNDGMLDEFDTESILRKLPSAKPEAQLPEDDTTSDTTFGTWIPVSKRLPTDYDGDFAVIDEFYNQTYVPLGVLTIKDEEGNMICYDSAGFEFDVKKFLAGREVEICGRKYKLPPRRIIAWTPLPKRTEIRNVFSDTDS